MQPKLLRFSLLLASLLCLSNARGEQKETTAIANAFARLHSSHGPANATSCVECHSIPGDGGSSRRTAMRAGSIVDGKYVAVPNGGILHTINYDTSATSATIYGPRVTLSLLGDGFVEAVRDEEFENIAREEARKTQGKVHGEVVYLTPSQRSGVHKVVGRFGWKAQHASLVDASADALLHELGVPSRTIHAESSAIKGKASERTGARDNELGAMVEFIRGTEPAAPDLVRSGTEDAQAGSEIFDRVGCSLCHVRTLKTAPSGTRLAGSGIVVSERLGNREIHPFSDYLLHDVGTGDGIIQNVKPQDYTQSTANKFRTAPLWGVRFRLWLMHDGSSLTYHQAIMRHRGEALSVTLNYAQLTSAEKEKLWKFLGSL